MDTSLHDPALLTHDPLGAGPPPTPVGAGLRRAFSLATDAAVETWAEVTGHRAAGAWVHWQVRAVLYRHGMDGAAGDRCAGTVAGFVSREAARAAETGRDPRRAVLDRIPREAFKASALWPGLCPALGRAREWAEFLADAQAFYARANTAAAAAVAASDTATTFGPMSTGELRAETARIARWMWGTFTAEPVPVQQERRSPAGSALRVS
ncbi:hypothetical protein [Kocuria flava]|uniref:hypothetical protein n=1 Tax=Kocuria flava TaxID=446860 RepID=UPI002F9260E7